MTTTQAPTGLTRLDRLRRSPLSLLALSLAVLLGVAISFLGAAERRPDEFGPLLLVGSVGLAALVVGLVSPTAALGYLLFTTFFRLVIPSGHLPVDPFLLAFALLLFTVGLRLARGLDEYPSPGLLEVAIGLYLVVNIASAVTPHQYVASFPDDGTGIEVSRYLVIGVLMPLAVLMVGIAAFHRDDVLRLVVIAVLLFAGYSAFTSIMTFYGPAALVFPSFQVSNPGWSGRAVGVFRQPVVNGLVLNLGFLCAVLMASRRSEPRWLRYGALAGIPMMLVGIYLTHTRGVWLALIVMIVMGSMMAKGWRAGFVVPGVLITAGVALNWATFTSSDRSAGGVGSSGELEDRLNNIATATWAISQHPLLGWGLARFPAVNTYHHRQYSPSVPWERGFGIASHLDVLGVTTELGLVGGAAYVLVLTAVIVQLARSVRVLSVGDAFAGQVAVLATLGFACWMVIGLTVDPRFFDFSNIVVMVLAGGVIGRARRVRRDVPVPEPAAR